MCVSSWGQGPRGQLASVATGASPYHWASSLLINTTLHCFPLNSPKRPRSWESIAARDSWGISFCLFHNRALCAGALLGHPRESGAGD